MALNTAVEASSPVEWQGLVKLAASEVAASGLRRLKGFVPSMPVFRADGLAHSVPPLVRGNPDIAAEIYRGRFRLGDTVVDAGGRSIFDHTAAPAAWLEELHGFTWLIHLRASGRERYQKIPFRKRDDEAEMRKHVDANWKRILPRW